jgi:hypothetical protein
MRIKSDARGIRITNFKLYYRSIVTKTAWYWHKSKYIVPWSQIDDPEISPDSYIGEKVASSQMVLEKLYTHMLKTLISHPVQKSIQNGSKNPESLEVLLELVGKTLENIGISQDFLNRALIAQEIKAGIDK